VHKTRGSRPRTNYGKSKKIGSYFYNIQPINRAGRVGWAMCISLRLLIGIWVAGSALWLLTAINIIIKSLYNHMKNLKIGYCLFLVAFLFTTASAQYIVQFETPVGNMSATDLKELVIESERNLESYRFILAEDQYIEIINLTKGNKPYQTRLSTLGSGAFNLTGRAAKVVTASLSYPVGLEENATATTTEVYVLNDTLYSKVDGNLTAIKMSFPESVWVSQNRLNRSAELTNASTIRLLGAVTINGEVLYVVEVIPENGLVSSLISKQLGSSLPRLSMNLSSLFNNTQLRYILWISKDGNLPRAEYIQTNMTVAPGMLGLPGKGDMEIHIDSIITLRFSDFNKSISIVLPEQNNTKPSPSVLARSQGVSSQDPDPSGDNGSLTPEQQQEMWLAGAYRFLNGDYYPYNSYFYSSPYMPYPARSYYPYYAPYYTPYSSYNAPYAFPAQAYPVPTQGYAAPAQVTAPTPAYTSSATGYTIMTAGNSSIGTYLTDGRGITLYHLQSDQGSYTSKCSDATCTGIWPPFYSGSINVPGGLNPTDFSIITVNGYKQYQQTTFKGWPLYYFYKDMKPGDVFGQGLKDSYGVWSVVSPETPSTFPANFPYQSGVAATAQNQYPIQQPSTITLTPSQPTNTISSPYPTLPTPRPVTTPISGNVPVTVRYPGTTPFDVYIDGIYVGTGSGGSFNFSANSGVHSIRVWDGHFDYVKGVSLESGVPKIIYVQAA